MAVAKTITCDRCGEVIAKERGKLVVMTGFCTLHREHIDACRICSDALVSWLAAGTTAGGPAR